LYLLLPQNLLKHLRAPLEGDDEIRKMAEAIMDKVVDQLLNEAAEIVLKED
jgi:hypothetical protein